MAKDCDIKTSAQAWNHGVDSFEKSFLLTGDMDTALQYGITEVQKKFPDLKFDTDSFANPIIKAMKGAEEIPNSYSFGKKKNSDRKYQDKMEERMFRQDREEELAKQKTKDKLEKEIEKIIDKMDGLKPNEKKDVARKIFDKMHEKGILTEDVVKNIYAEALGMPAVTPELDEKIEQASKDLKEEESIEKELTAIKTKVTSEENITEEEEKKYVAEVNQLKNKLFNAQVQRNKSLAALSKSLSKEKFWMWQFAPMISMNLMSIPSIGKNLTGMATDAIFRNLSSIVSTPLASLFLKRNLFFARWSGAGKNTAWKKFMSAVKTGSPIEKTKKLGEADYLNAVDSFQKFLDANGKDKIMPALATIIKAHPDFIRRALVAPDFFVHSIVEGAELNRIGKEKGLTGAKLATFIASPDEESATRAKERADSVTLKDKIPAKFLEDLANYNPEKHYERLIAGGKWSPLSAKIYTGLVGWAKSMYFPFVKAPWNLYKIAGKILLPEARLAKGVHDYYKAGYSEKKKLVVAETMGDVIVGMALRTVALNMIAAGALSAGYDDDDEKTKEAVFKVAGGPNKVNVSSFFRGITGGNIQPKPGDHWTDMSSLGVVGLALGGYASAYHKMSAEQIKQESSYSANLWNTLKVPKDLFVGQAQASIDLPFLSGTNQILDVIKDKKGGKIDRFIATSLKTLLGGIVPASHQQLSRSSTGDVYVSYDKEKSFSENVFSTLKYNFAFGEGIKKKMSTLTSTEREAIKKKEHHFFDNYLGRVLFTMDPLKVTETSEKEGDYPVFRLYTEAMKLDGEQRDKLFPSAPTNDFNAGSSRSPAKIKLTDKQHEYYQQQASLYRMLYSAPYIMSADWEKDSYDEKVKVLDGLYKEGLNKAKIDVKEMFPELKKTAPTEKSKVSVKGRLSKYKQSAERNAK